jgi:isoleucyl-tRNA synthetase
MTQNNNSVHLQNIPDLSFIKSDNNLIENMDLIRNICSIALFIRDKYKLRVRLPLANLRIISEKSQEIADFTDIIKDEVNVKNIEFSNEISKLAEFKLQLNFKKIGSKFGPKMKEISIAAKKNDWQKLENGDIKIAGEILSQDDFEIKLTTKDPEKIFPLPTNDCLIELDLNITEELKNEGISRDIVRLIQQDRKEMDFDISDQINIVISCSDKLQKIILDNNDYIKNQTLGKKIEFSALKKNDNNFEHQIEGENLLIELQK